MKLSLKFQYTKGTLRPLEPDRWAKYKQGLKEGQFVRLTAEIWRKKRSTGPWSQNHHCNGHCQQISESTGQDFATVKAMAKIQAMDMGYPFTTYKDRVIPKSEADCDTAECALLIEAAHMIAADLGIILQEE